MSKIEGFIMCKEHFEEYKTIPPKNNLTWNDLQIYEDEVCFVCMHRINVYHRYNKTGVTPKDVEKQCRAKFPKPEVRFYPMTFWRIKYCK